ncbi:GNAT family N-acetyltransferase [Propionispora sp. 2/2-37]|uniref:GNAT family N-acetyltransferase n=1 Tax=Propionispora sp. 2/2-37 TaxID=1677858 RepID=UPI002101BE44|nr:GNAT family N-acetyltransferase [Propionispora sp. 2/2-37]
MEKEELTLFCRFDEGKRIIGVIGIKRYGQSCLLRSLAVSKEHRNKGIACVLLKEAFQFARNEKIIDAYLLTETIGDMLKCYGFNEVSRETVPADILTSPFFNGICPLSSQLLHRKLEEGDCNV